MHGLRWVSDQVCRSPIWHVCFKWVFDQVCWSPMVSDQDCFVSNGLRSGMLVFDQAYWTPMVSDQACWSLMVSDQACWSPMVTVCEIACASTPTSNVTPGNCKTCCLILRTGISNDLWTPGGERKLCYSYESVAVLNNNNNNNNFTRCIHDYFSKLANYLVNITSALRSN